MTGVAIDTAFCKLVPGTPSAFNGRYRPMKHKFDLLRLAVAFTASAFTGCASSPAASPETETRVALDESGRITYVGDITTAANERAMEIFEASQDKPETLLIF